MIQVQNLNKTYDRGRRNANQVLRGVSFDLPDTGFVCIVGASGCGKTSLLNAVGGLDVFDNGTIATGSVTASRYGSRELERERNNSFGYIFQNYYLLPEHSVAYNVYLGLHALDLTHREKLGRVREALHEVNMDRYARRTVGELSGGQQQRVAIARALARRPRVIFADEPTGNLDEENTLNICTLLRRISKTSLVIMVTHEETIARFFADRIITLSEGQIVSDDKSWQREQLSVAGDALYAGDYEETRLELDQINLRVLRQQGSEPVNLTVAILADRIVLKLDDGRTVSCSTNEEVPKLLEGKRPVLTLEALDNEPVAAEQADSRPVALTRAGKGLTFPMMLEEAGRLLRGKGLRRLGAWVFLVAMSVLTTIMVGDYLTVSSVEPQDFVITDSHILEFELERGPNMPIRTTGILGQMENYYHYLQDSGLDFDVMPYVNTQLRYSTDVFLQMGAVTEPIQNFSHALISRLDESKLIYGRMPEKTEEIVIDRWVLDAFLERDGIIQSGIPDISAMLGAQLNYFKKDYSPVIVGICDCGEPTVYLPAAGIASVGVAGTPVIPLSELQRLYPGQYDDAVLGQDECIVIYNNAGIGYKTKVGSKYNASSNFQYSIVGSIEAEDTWAHLVLEDDAVEGLLGHMANATPSFQMYCADKAAMKAYLAQGLSEELDGVVLVNLKDSNSDAWARYRYASHIKADARTIVTVTVIVLCLVMLFLLQRSCVQQRIGMMAVYRLLGIPRCKLLSVFAIESGLLSLLSVLPATILTWLTVQIMNRLPSLEFSMVLTWQAALVVFAAITVYHLLVSLIPVFRLLGLPPAQLAGKYDL